MTKALLLLALALVPGTATAAPQDPETAAREVITVFVSGLAQDNPESALTAVSRTLPEYAAFASKLRALLQQFQVTSSVSPQSNKGDGGKRELQLDWYVEIKSKSGDLELIRRRETVRCTVERTANKGRWMITAIEPLRFFAPPVF